MIEALNHSVCVVSVPLSLLCVCRTLATYAILLIPLPKDASPQKLRFSPASWWLNYGGSTVLKMHIDYPLCAAMLVCSCLVLRVAIASKMPSDVLLIVLPPHVSSTSVFLSDSVFHSTPFKVQWNPSIAATLGEQHFGRYIEVAFIEGLFCTNCSFGTWIPGRYTEVAFIQGWPLRGDSI